MKISDYVMNQQSKLLGHLIRGDGDDPMKHATINEYFGQPESPNQKRVGRPRLKWVEENCKYIFRKLENDEFDYNDHTKMEILRNHAMNIAF